MKIIKTEDGSSTIFNDEVGEYYHSYRGAYTESLHVFIYPTFDHYDNQEINILEIGLGTGLNALLTYLEGIKRENKVNYTSIEKFPIDIEIVHKLGFEDDIDLIDEIHSQDNFVRDNFTFNKIIDDFNSIDIKGSYDVIYFDAFSPESQPDMWTYQGFKKLYDVLKNDGILLTYSSKGIVKQLLRDVGFVVKRLKGANGKRHMIKAIKYISDI